MVDIHVIQMLALKRSSEVFHSFYYLIPAVKGSLIKSNGIVLCRIFTVSNFFYVYRLICRIGIL
jgi:hypothetical protein